MLPLFLIQKQPVIDKKKEKKRKLITRHLLYCLTFLQIITYIYTLYFTNIHFISGPVIPMVLEKENAVADWRALIGPTDARKAKLSHPQRFTFSSLVKFFVAVGYALISMSRFSLFMVTRIRVKLYTGLS